MARRSRTNSRPTARQNQGHSACCLPPTQLTRQPDEPHAERPVDEEGVLLYQAPQTTPNKQPEKHVWLEPGKFKRNGKDTFTRRIPVRV